VKVPYVNIAKQHKPIKTLLLDVISKVIDRGDFIFGEEVSEFEERFAGLCGVRFAVGLNSGTDALILALRALDIGSGDEVITVPNSFIASTSCIILTGAAPVFVDVCDDYNIDADLIEKAITQRTRAILPVHLTGQPADMDPITEIARKHGLHVIEDCAQAVCAEYKGRRVGSFGTAGCFSLHPLKTLNACGDGGVVTTDDESLYERIKILRNVGLKTRDDCVIWSSNSRLDTIQSAILLVKMNYLEEWTSKRRANAKFYQDNLNQVAEVKVPLESKDSHSVYHTFVIEAENRDGLQAHLGECGIGTAIHYPVPIHLHTAAANLGYKKGDFPTAERQSQRILSLPVYPELRTEDLENVVTEIKKFYQKNNNGD
jgi:dTDP-4-amino-4,6-dideoxygalactose transaminase